MAIYNWLNTDQRNIYDAIRANANNRGFAAATADITTGATTDLLAAPGANLYWGITQLLVTNAHATVGTFVKIIDEGGAILARGYAAAGGGGFSCTYNSGIPLMQNQANIKVQVICETAGAQVCVSANAFKVAQA